MFDFASLSDTLSGVHLMPPSLGVMVAFVLTIILLFLSGFAGGSEIAFFSLSPPVVS